MTGDDVDVIGVWDTDDDAALPNPIYSALTHPVMNGLLYVFVFISPAYSYGTMLSGNKVMPSLYASLTSLSLISLLLITGVNND